MQEKNKILMCLVRDFQALQVHFYGLLLAAGRQDSVSEPQGKVMSLQEDKSQGPTLPCKRSVFSAIVGSWVHL